jgi:hypothetical protein
MRRRPPATERGAARAHRPRASRPTSRPRPPGVPARPPQPQRRGRDSNPGDRGCRSNGFQDRRIQPLCHPSGVPDDRTAVLRSTLDDPRRGGRAAEGTRLLSEYGAKSPSRVRIPPSPFPRIACKCWVCLMSPSESASRESCSCRRQWQRNGSVHLESVISRALATGREDHGETTTSRRERTARMAPCARPSDGRVRLA